MDYEARMDARNEYIAEQIRENTPDESEYTMDEDIPEVIAEGVFDVAVLKRAAAILVEQEFGEEADLLREIVEVLYVG